jgi:D-xylose transport system substrate-binding protein
MARSGFARTLAALAAITTVALAGCATNPPSGSTGGGGGGGGAPADAKIAFLMPDQNSTRYEQHDAPGFKAELAKICPGCTPLYNNANADATKQQQQFNAAIAQGAKAIVLDPVDSTAAASLVNTAKAQGVKVIAYDRPIPSIPADYYVSCRSTTRPSARRSPSRSCRSSTRARSPRARASSRSTAHRRTPRPD